jgi:hypothetical protein
MRQRFQRRHTVIGLSLEMFALKIFSLSVPIGHFCGGCGLYPKLDTVPLGT